MRTLGAIIAGVALCGMSCCVAAPIGVAVFDADKAGGASFGEAGILRALADLPSYHVSSIEDLTATTLEGVDVLILPDVHDVGGIGAAWPATVLGFANAGGGVLLTHDSPGLNPSALFPTLVAGSSRHVETRLTEFSNHPLTCGLCPFSHAFGDHRDPEPGSEAQIAMRCADGRAVAIAGAVGRGRVVVTGLALGLGGTGEEEPVAGDELRFLDNAVTWLAGGVPGGRGALPLVRLSVASSSIRQPDAIAVQVTACWLGGPLDAGLNFQLTGPDGAVVRQGVWAIVADAAAAEAGRYVRATWQQHIATDGLPDGTYTLTVAEQSLCPDAPVVALRGNLLSADAERTARMLQLHGGSAIKFDFNQGYEFRKDESRLAPYMKRLREQGCTAYDYMSHSPHWLYDEDAFVWLQKVCQAAAFEGLRVWATLAPPSEIEQLRKMPREQAYQYFHETVERFARISLQYPNFVGYTCDDFSNDLGFFTPEVVAEMVGRQRRIAPDLAFMPLLYWNGISEAFRERYGPYIDGIVFHFRAGSYPPGYIPGYDPKSFEMYGDVMRYEFKRVREVMGDKPVLAGLYLWYYKGGWGVMTPDGADPTNEHMTRDAVQKVLIAHEYADGVRLYGCGIDQPLYTAMGEHFRQWQDQRSRWGQERGDPKAHLLRWQGQLGAPPHLGVLLGRPTAWSEGLAKATGWPVLELGGSLREGDFDGRAAVAAFPLLNVEVSSMPRDWGDRLLDYATRGGTLLLEGVPGWSLDLTGDAPREGEKPAGDLCPLTLQFAAASGVTFHYEPRGFVTRCRVVAAHPLTEGLSAPGEWLALPSPADPAENYGRLAYNTVAAGATVLIEGEQEKCPYDGVHYVRGGEALGVRPLLTVATCGEGVVVRHYAAASAPAVFGDEQFGRLVANLARWARARGGTEVTDR